MAEVPRARVLAHSSADLNAAANAALDFLAHDFSGQRVWVKPNLIGPFPPGRGATTDPELVRRMVGSLRARGAAEVWVADNPGGWLRGSVETYLAPTGIVEASDGCFRNIVETPVTLPLRSRFIKEVRVCASSTKPTLSSTFPCSRPTPSHCSAARSRTCSG